MFFEISNQDIETNHKKTEIIYHTKLSHSSFFAKMIKIPKKDTSANLSYQELPRTIEDEAKIDELITILGTHGKIDIFFNNFDKRCYKIRDEINYLHPFKFLGYIFSHPHLKAHMKVVYEDYFKRTNFEKGLSETLDIYDLRNKINIYLENFSSEINIPQDKIKYFIDKRDWNGLLKFLVYY